MKDFQYHDTESIGDNTKGQRFFSTFLKVVGVTILIAFGVVNFNSGYKIGGGIQLLAALLYFFFIHKIAWSIGNGFRKWVMPEGFIADSATDAFRQKMFWNIGPQFSSWFFAIVLLGWSGQYFVEDASQAKKNNSVQQNSGKSSVGSPEVEVVKPPKFVVPTKFQGKWFVDELFSKTRCNQDPLEITEDGLKIGAIENTLKDDGGNLISGAGDKFIYNDNGTLSVFTVSDSRTVEFKKCETEAGD